MAISDTEWTVHDRANLHYCERLVDGQDLYLVVWGEADVWTKAVIKKIKDTYLSGVRPWMCQGRGCANRQCPECGKAVKRLFAD